MKIVKRYLGDNLYSFIIVSEKDKNEYMDTDEFFSSFTKYNLIDLKKIIDEYLTATD